jgi:hypothetical protein
MSKQGLIYEIICNQTNERYIGSTFESTVARRIVAHRAKTNHCCSKQIIDRNNYSYDLIETVFVNTRDELRMKEREWFEKKECINIRKPFSSKEEKISYNREKANINRKLRNIQYSEYSEKLKQQLRKAKEAYRQRNLEKCRLQNLNRYHFLKEVKRLSNIEIFN